MFVKHRRVDVNQQNFPDHDVGGKRPLANRNDLQHFALKRNRGFGNTKRTYATAQAQP